MEYFRRRKQHWKWVDRKKDGIVKKSKPEK
jgi:hypothetical protein